MVKRCIVCKKLLDISNFYKAMSNKDKHDNLCKDCKRKYKIKWRNTNRDRIRKQTKDYRNAHPWIYVYDRIQQRCENTKHWAYKYYGGRGIKCLITIEEIKKLWFRDKAYLMKQPSIDRIDNDGNYEYSNCQFIEVSENSKKRAKDNPQGKVILQFDLKGNFIKEWESITEASNKLKICRNGIHDVLRKKYKTGGGFYWEYKR